MNREEVLSRSGRGIRIAVVDSGMNPNHPHVGRVAGGCALSEVEGVVRAGSDWLDRHGHGSAVTGVLRAKLPDAELFAVRVFFGRLIASPRVIAAAIHWATEQRVHIVNLSLGTEHPESGRIMSRACRYALERGVILVAAAPVDPHRQYPATEAGVLGASPDSGCGWDEIIYRRRRRVSFFTHGFPRKLPGLALPENFRGPSFAAAHLSAFIARFLEWNPVLRGAALHDALVDLAADPPRRMRGL